MIANNRSMTDIPIYDSSIRGNPIVRELVELWRYRDLLPLMIANNIKRRYKRSVIGVAWTLLNPLLTMVVLTLALSHIFRFSLEHYPVYVLSGLLLWNFHAQSSNYAMHSLVSGSGLIKHVYFPRSVFAAAAVGTGLVNLLFSLVPLLLIMLVLGHPIRLSLLFLPVAAALAALFTFGLSLLLSTVAVFFTDVVEMHQILLASLFYLTPVIYPLEILPAQYHWLLNINPLYPLLDVFRTPIYLGVLPSLPTILAAAGWAIFALTVGWWVFTAKANAIGYRI